MSVEDHQATLHHFQANFRSALTRLSYSRNSDLVMQVLFYGHELEQRMGEDELRQWLDKWCKARAASGDEPG